MASVIDNEFARRGRILPDFEGISLASAANDYWVREKTETERDFIGRVRAAAKAAGYSTVTISGAFNVAPN